MQTVFWNGAQMKSPMYRAMPSQPGPSFWLTFLAVNAAGILMAVLLYST